MSRLDPAVAEVRHAVRACLPPATDRPLVLVACSGGADSLALAAAAAFVAPRQGWRPGLITVDHGLQEGSAERAKALVEWASAHFDRAEAVRVDVGRKGGPEAAARDARYEALVRAGRDARMVLLGHNEDDQAETVLLALARGAGPRGLSGMPVEHERDGVRFARPLLGVSRRTCRRACEAQGLTPWEDPHNTDPAYARSRVRSDVMPVLVEALGADVVPNLARTARLLSADQRYLEAQADAFVAPRLPVRALEGLDEAIRTRVLHKWALSLGVPGAALSHRHIAALDALVTDWHGQGPAMLPGGVVVQRKSGVLEQA
ncbi:tRNA lysidine(34) synthetase TilS [Allorhizocola rhizosphaerae]|uniref:tRNA lysidine(34) synthetase TilS n=1 Tax=Allorhizocola rhizosphaerae TaxID=1872709 RepID=UPI000E3C818F|nr:tRNA lysidine(34) synthetase TilS [Allorhizocola rhizosphaerae]